MLLSKELFGDDVRKEIDEVAKANRLGKKLASHNKGRVSCYQPYVTQRRSTGHSGQSRIRLEDKGCSKAQAFLGVRSTDHRNPTARPGIHPNPGITPPQVRFDISIRIIADFQVLFFFQIN